MKAVVFDRTGNPEDVLTIRDVPEPVPPAGHVRVRMLASPVNPSDLLFIRGRYGLKANPPTTPGFEGVGVVEACGWGILGWLRKGKRVAVLNDRTGNWQESCIVPARQVVPLPASLTDQQAATFFVNPATAIVLTRYVLQIPRGGLLLQSAAGSALGRMIIRLGKLQGFQTINVVRRREQVDELKALGADVVLCEADGPIDEQVRSHTPEGVRYAIDPVGGKTGTGVVASLAAGGRAICYGLLSGEPISVDPRFLITGSKSVEGFWLTDWVKKQSIPTMLGLFRRIKGLLQSGVLTTDIAKEYPLDQVRDAVIEAERPGKSGKVILRIAPSRIS